MTYLGWFWPLTSDLGFVAETLTSLTGSVTEKGVNCRRLKDQLDALERETTDKLAEMEQYNKELKVSGQKRAFQDKALTQQACFHLFLFLFNPE